MDAKAEHALLADGWAREQAGEVDLIDARPVPADWEEHRCVRCGDYPAVERGVCEACLNETACGPVCCCDDNDPF